MVKPHNSHDPERMKRLASDPYGRDQIPTEPVVKKPSLLPTFFVVTCCFLWIAAGVMVDEQHWGLAGALAAVGLISLVAGSTRT